VSMTELKLQGKAWKYGDNISTDLIIPGKYKFRITDIAELVKHAMEGADPTFAQKIKPGDMLVAGKNFGCGSSREHAPLVLKRAGISAVIAKSYARIFQRNAINIGLPALESPEAPDKINQGDQVEVDLEEGTITDLTSGARFETKPLPNFLLQILRDGGLVEHFKKHKDFKWEM